MKILIKDLIKLEHMHEHVKELQHIWYASTRLNSEDLNAMYCIELYNFVICDNYEWIKENITNGFTYYSPKFYFDDENDALLFKLKFG